MLYATMSMKTKLFILLLALVSCSKSNDPASSQPKTDPNFPVPALLGTWQLAYENVTDCGKNNGSFQGTSNQKMVFTSTKVDDGNYRNTYQGSNLEYQLKGDSIFLFTFDSNNKVVGWKKGVYKLSNVLLITGKYTVINQLAGCSFEDQLQK